MKTMLLLIDSRKNDFEDEKKPCEDSLEAGVLPGGQNMEQQR